MSHPAMSDHLKAILALPAMVLLVIPGLILYFTEQPIATNKGLILLMFLGLLLLGLGLGLFLTCLSLFIRIGKGTLAPWKPTQKLVITGPYRYMRNPMISGVILMLLAEACLLNHAFIVVWSLVFFVINSIYFRFFEEPALVKRFGADYQIYRNAVPRWLPRLTPFNDLKPIE